MRSSAGASGCRLAGLLRLACLAAWLPGCLAAWLPGCLAAWLPGCLAAWLPGCSLSGWLLPAGRPAGWLSVPRAASACQPARLSAQAPGPPSSSSIVLEWPSQRFAMRALHWSFKAGTQAEHHLIAVAPLHAPRQPRPHSVTKSDRARKPDSY